MARAKKQDAAADLAEQMVRTLEAQRCQGPGSYPLTLQQLAELAAPLASPELIEQALKKKSFKDQALVVLKNNLQSPIGLAADVEQLAASPLVLEAVLATLCTSQTPLW